MIFGGIFDRFPKLRVAFAHGGGAFPITAGRIEHAFHVRPDLCATVNKSNPRSYLANGDTPARFYVDSLVHDPDALRLLIKLFGAQRLGEAHPGELIEALEDISADEKSSLFSGTAQEFLGVQQGI
jgi:aminocarboxymuconate-semialdehyde decarboxylase